MTPTCPRTRPALIVALATLVLTGACTIPTDAPVTDVRWVVPGTSTSIAVASYLPSGVTILPDSSGFTVSIAPVSVTRALNQDCPACVAANGLTAPKPAFVGVASASTNLPASLNSATLSSGTLQLVVKNNYNFDPLKPSASSAAATGFAVITVTNNGTQIGKDSVNGATTTLAPATSLTRSIPLSGVVTGTQPVIVTMTLNSPAGDPVTIDASRTIVITATPQNIVVPTASIAVVNKPISSSSTEDLSSVDSSITRHIQTGAIDLAITNPFSATGNLTLTLTPDQGAAIVKAVAIANGNSSVVVPFTGAELQRLLGHNVTINYSGTVSSSTGGFISVTPKETMLVQSHFDLSLELGTVTP